MNTSIQIISFYTVINKNGAPAVINVQWNLSVATTSIMKFITCDLFSNVF